MSQLVPFRGFNRSQKVGLGGKDLRPNASTFINIDNPRVIRDLGRHSAIGSIFAVGSAFYQNDDGYVEYGGSVTKQAAGLVLDVTTGGFRRANGAAGTITAGTATLGAADATNPRIDTIVVNTTTGAVSVIAGTATAGAHLSEPSRTGFRAGVGTVPADRIVLAYVLLPATATNPTTVIDARP